MGCSRGQGFLYGRPMPATTADRLAHEWATGAESAAS
jgi:EAL domain-containing protein (putative c-di-GMP-specific phosphodiesterase class I)